MLVAPVEQGLMTFNKEGKVIPGLAESENPNPTTYVYKLKPGIKFSDGKPMTIEDVLFSLERARSSDESQVASFFENVASIKAKGSDAVEVKLKKPEVAWESVPVFAGQIMEKAAAEKGGVKNIGTPSNLPIGSGPYKFTSFNPSTGATLERNPHWDGAKGGPETITVKFFTEEAQAALALRSGEIEGQNVYSKGPFEVPGVNLLSAAGTSVDALSMNTIEAPFNDIHVRKAMAYAADREGMSQAVFSGAAEPIGTLTPVSLYGNIAPAAEVEKSFAGLPEYEFNLEKAKEELSKSKYPEGFSTGIATESGSNGVKMAQILAPDFAKIGIKLEIEQLPSSAYLARLYGPRDKVGLMIDEYGANSPDPSSLMIPWLAPEQAKVNGLNTANYKSDEMGRLLTAQGEEADKAKRLQLITEAFRLMKEDAPYAPLVSPEVFLALSDKYAFNEFSNWTAEFTPWPLLVQPAS
jgi:peptide/nickel transport system substrate-binding protein